MEERNMNVYVITENTYKMDVVMRVFEKKYPEIKKRFYKIASLNPNIQTFEEEIEYHAYQRIQDFILNPEYSKKKEVHDFVCGIQTGLKKSEDGYQEVTFVLMRCFEKTYCLDSKEIQIPREYDSYIFAAQQDREKIFQIYDQMGFEKRREGVIEETLEELFQMIYEKNEKKE